MVNSFKVILKVVTKTSGKSVESSNNDIAWTRLPEPEKPLLQLSWGQNSQAQTVTGSIYYHRRNQEPTPGSLGSACDWERAVGRTPISHVWAVSSQQVCWVQESWCLGLYVCMAQEVSLNRLLLDKTKDSQNQGQELHRHQLKMEIRLGSLHQDVHFTLITKHKEGCTGLYWIGLWDKMLLERKHWQGLSPCYQQAAHNLLASFKSYCYLCYLLLFGFWTKLME